MKIMNHHKLVKQSALIALLFCPAISSATSASNITGESAVADVSGAKRVSVETDEQSKDQSPSKAQSHTDIEVITTTSSRNEVPLSEVPLALTVIGQKHLNEVGLVHVEEAMQLVAGSNMHRGNGQEYLPALRSQVLSGAGACGGILTLEDGIPLRSAGFCNINELFEAHTEMASRIEVLKGPGSPLYGSNAIHGVINVVMPNAGAQDTRLGIDLGSYGYSRGRVSTGTQNNEHGLGVIASVTNDTGYRDDESVKQSKVSLRHRYTPKASALSELLVVSGLTYTDLDQETAGFIEGFESYKDVELAQKNFNPDAFRQASSLRAWSSVSWRYKQTDIAVTPYVRSQDMTFFKHFLPGTPLEKNGQTGFGVQSLFERDISPNLTLSYGVDAESTAAEFSQFQDNPTQGSAFLVATIPQGKHYDYDVDALMWAGFVDASWQHNRWQVNLGGRFESIEYDYKNKMRSGRTTETGEVCGFGGCRYSRPASSINRYDNFSPSVSVVYDLNDNVELYSNISKGYRAPQGAELFQLQREQTIADLEPEEVVSVELGMKGFYQQGRYLVSVYDMKKQNTIYRDSDFFTISNGQTSHRGIELELAWQVNQALDVTFAGSHSIHQYDSEQLSGGVNINGNDIDTAPRNVATLLASYKVTEQTKLGASWRAVSSYFTNPENINKYEGHQVFDAFVHWQWTDNLKLRFQMKNAFDTRYAERADYTSFTQERYFPGKPRNFMLSVDYKW